MEDAAVLFAKLESRGESQVRIELAQGIWSEPRTVALVKEWLALKDRARASEDSAKRDAREKETLSIAKEANRIASESLPIARTAVLWARYAAIIATAAMAYAAKDSILALIFGNP